MRTSFLMMLLALLEPAAEARAKEFETRQLNRANNRPSIECTLAVSPRMIIGGKESWGKPDKHYLEPMGPSTEKAVHQEAPYLGVMLDWVEPPKGEWTMTASLVPFKDVRFYSVTPTPARCPKAGNDAKEVAMRPGEKAGFALTDRGADKTEALCIIAEDTSTGARVGAGLTCSMKHSEIRKKERADGIKVVDPGKNAPADEGAGAAR